ncbi:MAG: MaoC family dehydratase [Myxococcota bacterium]
MALKTVSGISGLQELAGQSLGETEWLEIDQKRVDLFADATLDHQWIHTDPQRAKDTPFGGTIAHGYLSLSLLPHLLWQLLEVKEVSMILNYGLNKVRFPSPLPVGKRVRLRAEAASVEPVKGGAELRMNCTMELEGGTKPVMVAEVLYRYYE